MFLCSILSFYIACISTMNLNEQDDILITNAGEFDNMTEEEFFGDDIMISPLDHTDDNIQYIHPDECIRTWY